MTQEVTDVFVFGAGASHGSGECYWSSDKQPRNPPLGNGPEGLFRALQERGGIAATIEQPLSDMFVENFEYGMDCFYAERETDATTFLRELAQYLVQFQPGANNCYKRLLQILPIDSRKFVLSTTNYDLLIEYSLGGVTFAVPVYDLFGFQSPLSVLKIHGSCNILPAVPPGALRNVQFEGASGGNVGGPVRIATPSEALNFCQTEDSLAPVMSIYARGKKVLYCPEFVEEQQKRWKEAVTHAETIYVVGLAVNEEDTHIWETLETAEGRLEYVDPNPKAFEEWCQSRGRKGASVFAPSFEKAIEILAEGFDRTRLEADS